MNKRILKAIIADAVDIVYGSVQQNDRTVRDIMDELGLTEEQAKVAIDITLDVSDREDWHFNDASDEYSAGVVDKFLERFIHSIDGKGKTLIVYEGDLENFIKQFKEMAK
jgi:hypothetical protein